MTKILVLDLETIGLDVELDPILEVGAILFDLKTEQELAVVHSIPRCLPGVRYSAHIDRTVYAMHTKNGLFDAVARGETNAIVHGYRDGYRWELSILKMLTEAGFTKGECMMAGRTPSFDRRFLARYAPDLNAFLSHRMIDVSTLTQLTKAWGPEKAEDPTRKDDPHRALKDCRQAIKTLLKYRPVFAAFDLYPERANKQALAPLPYPSSPSEEAPPESVELANKADWLNTPEGGGR